MILQEHFESHSLENGVVWDQMVEMATLNANNEAINGDIFVDNISAVNIKSNEWK